MCSGVEMMEGGNKAVYTELIAVISERVEGMVRSREKGGHRTWWEGKYEVGGFSEAQLPPVQGELSVSSLLPTCGRPHLNLGEVRDERERLGGCSDDGRQ